jgi:hypothetical protein
MRFSKTTIIEHLSINLADEDYTIQFLGRKRTSYRSRLSAENSCATKIVSKPSEIAMAMVATLILALSRMHHRSTRDWSGLPGMRKKTKSLTGVHNILGTNKHPLISQ